MRSELAELTDFEVMRQIRTGRDPRRGLTVGQVLQIERRALAKLRRLMGGEMMFRLRALAQEAARERHTVCTVHLNIRALLPMTSVDDMEPIDLGADLDSNFPRPDGIPTPRDHRHARGYPVGRSRRGN